MNDSKIKSRTGKIKTWWIDFYRAPYFWTKLISSLLISGLALFGLFTIISSAFYYFSEPLSHFDAERLGQLGDFLGGTLNPIFGFSTVLLLLWSVFIQRKELKETSKSLEQQNKLMLLEQTRTELIPIMREYHSKLKKRAKQKFEIQIDGEDSPLSLFFGDYKTMSLANIYNISKGTTNLAEYLNSQFMSHDPRQYNYFSPIYEQLLETKNLMEEIDRLMTDYISVAQLKSVERYWFTQYQNSLRFCTEVGAISEDEQNNYMQRIMPIRQEFIFP